MAKMGLRQSANRDIRPAATRAAAGAAPGGRLVEADEVSRLFGEKELFVFFLSSSVRAFRSPHRDERCAQNIPPNQIASHGETRLFRGWHRRLIFRNGGNERERRHGGTIRILPAA